MLAGEEEEEEEDGSASSCSFKLVKALSRFIRTLAVIHESSLSRHTVQMLHISGRRVVCFLMSANIMTTESKNKLIQLKLSSVYPKSDERLLLLQQRAPLFS